MSVELLRRADPTILQNYSPRAVGSDGNCFYRSISLALYGTETYHTYLRVLTAIEICKNPATYNADSTDFVGNGLPIFTPDYRQLLRDTVSNGAYSEMIHLFALSKAMALPIQSYCCPLENAPSSSLHPYSMFINKSRYEKTFKSIFVTVMWTMTSASESEPNHFVLLVPYLSLTHLTPPVLQPQSDSLPFTTSPNISHADLAEATTSAKEHTQEIHESTDADQRSPDADKRRHKRSRKRRRPANVRIVW